jgi:cyclic pyranopterin phosphate synthase
MSKLTHLDEDGAARMVDVSAKDATDREATAEARIVLSAEAFAAIASGDAPKGDVLAAARIAGIMGAKKTSELIPLCHPIALTKASVAFEMVESESAVRIVASAKTTGPTGVEMEALTAASVAALTIYDMIKAVDRSAVIDGVRLVAKSGGKSGAYPAAARKKAFAKNSEAPRPAVVTRGKATPATLMGEVAMPQRGNPAAEREAFRAFMTGRHLRATEWAKSAGVAPSELYAFLTGRSRSLPLDAAEKLARAARVRVEDLFR